MYPRYAKIRRAAVLGAVTAGLWLAQGFPAQAIPQWALQTPEDQDNLYFLGMKIGAATLEEARGAAFESALREISRSLGTSVVSVTSLRSTEMGTSIRSEIDLFSKSSVQGQHVVKMEVEELEGLFNVYLLLRYPKVEFERERAALRDVAVRRRQSVENALVDGAAAQAAGDSRNALSQFGAALSLADPECEPELLYRARSAAGQSLAAISVKFDSARRVALAQVESGTVILSAADAASGRPLKGLPVRLKLEQGSARIPERALTDSNGAVAVPLAGLSPVGRLELRATLDPEPLLAGFSGADRLALQPFMAQETRLDLLVVPANTEQSYHLRGANAADMAPEVLAQLRQSLEEFGFVEIADDFPADLEVQLDVTAPEPVYDQKNAVYVANGAVEVAFLQSTAGRRLGTLRVPAKAFGDTGPRSRDRLGVILCRDLTTRVRQFVAGQRLANQLRRPTSAEIESASFKTTPTAGSEATSH